MTNDRARLAKKRIEMQQQKTHEQTWLKTIIFHFVKTNEIFFPDLWRSVWPDWAIKWTFGQLLKAFGNN